MVGQTYYPLALEVYLYYMNLYTCDDVYVMTCPCIVDVFVDVACYLSIWRPSEELQEMLVEGTALRIHNTIANRCA